MENRKKCRMIYLGILLCIPLVFSSCNYIPCRGEYYIIENITHQEFINKLNEFREKHPEYIAEGYKDYIEEHLPWRMSIDLYWKDLDVYIDLRLYIGNTIPSPPTSLNFTSVEDKNGRKDINSRELGRKRNKQYKEKFEKEILDELGVEWKRERCW
ncbi:MAG: hypothetical protein FWC39_11375 [Bacteroidetes bacterium]|nr:hypothetical protein [Bacteroidota bacterium]